MRNAVYYLRYFQVRVAWSRQFYNGTVHLLDVHILATYLPMASLSIRLCNDIIANYQFVEDDNTFKLPINFITIILI